MKNRAVKYIAYIVIAITFISSCVTSGNYKYLSYVFDGVPNPEIKENLENDLIDSFTLIVAKDTANIKPLVNKHLPYATNECYVCHNKNAMGSYIKPQPALCYQCHDDYSENYNSIHGPVGAGYCTSCHSPHKTKSEKLLFMSISVLQNFSLASCRGIGVVPSIWQPFSVEFI